MSRLRRDRQAMKWARYSQHNEMIVRHAADVKESRRHWYHLGWMIGRKAKHAYGDDEQWWTAVGHVIRLFHP